MYVSASAREPITATQTVIAIGANIRPSKPSSEKMGRYTAIMMNTPNTIGRPTSTAASRINRRRGSVARCPACSSRRTKFSTMTTEASTSRPKSRAPRLIRFAEMPARSITKKANSSDNGMTEAVISEARRLRKNTNRISVTSSPPSSRFLKTVCVVRSTTSPWL